ncbi:MaoC/PaaZ C-terminal domain-containing protein [Marinobacter sp. CHS3-4]|uniref:MaoC/PaaZ C-terminal domain-containing protein n=1 Tax=Marinobacter sp. CHS3-4 TaxID=3045174 RepID=UPI0024B59C48|nr:MaoC/PaaZ C-terminal domain-containing protein [Marinobacter sp. CHS3-4]MDI9245990.1 MaoC/PaaZ C-terminal domain-containing protein [Marinobacter sp. CHS3-4]
MTQNAKYHNQPPGLLSMYGKALLPKREQSEITKLPDVSAQLIGVTTGGGDLKQYRKVCGFAPTRAVPATWPHILAFPLHLKVLTDPSIPFPLLGLVHLRNRIVQHRPIGEGEMLDLDVRLGEAVRTSKGLEFDLITEARSAGRLVWEENSTTLFRQPERDNGSSRKQPPELAKYANSVDIDVPESTGRQYAGVSGDRNPIHLYPLTAKLFGFPRAIAHGMWSKARVLAHLEQQQAWKSGAFAMHCDFKKPLFLPGQAVLNWESAKKGLNYQLLNGKGTAPHLSGHVEWLD